MALPRVSLAKRKAAPAPRHALAGVKTAPGGLKFGGGRAPVAKKAGVKAFARSKKPLLVLGRGDGRPNRAAGGTAG